ncbi:hypothetical protein ACGFJ7_08130 [Actinoplanes sp. NPDC048988]|uniref:hypothetical protein n=1 Tax=Actinoplanes sp. NPDC048988 TaxID=3363901 RepID=UPI00371E6506
MTVNGPGEADGDADGRGVAAGSGEDRKSTTAVIATAQTATAPTRTLRPVERRGFGVSRGV